MRPLFADGRSAFLVPDALVQNLPDQTTQPMGNGPDGLRVPEARHQTSVGQLEDTAFGLDRRVGRLIEQASHLPVALRRAVAIAHARTLVIARTGADPGREVLGRWKGRGGGPDFRDDLLRGVDAQPGHLGQPLHPCLVVTEQPRHLLIQLAKVVVDDSQLLKRQGEQPPVDRMQRRAGAERVAQLRRRRPKAPIRQRRQGLGVGLPVRQRLQHSSGTEAQ